MHYASPMCNIYMKVVKKKSQRPIFFRHITGNSGHFFFVPNLVFQ